MAGFARMKALSTSFNDQPEKASRPFDKDRDGMYYLIFGDLNSYLFVFRVCYRRGRWLVSP